MGGEGVDVDVDVASLSSGRHIHLRSSHRSPTLCSLASTSKPSKRTHVPSAQTHFFRCCWLLLLLLFAWDQLLLPVVVFTRGPDGLELVCNGGGVDGGFGWFGGLVSIVPGSVIGANQVGVGVGVRSRKSESSGSVHGSKPGQPPVDEYDGPSCKTQDRIEHPLKRTSSRIPRAHHSRGRSRRSYPSPVDGVGRWGHTKRERLGVDVESACWAGRMAPEPTEEVSAGQSEHVRACACRAGRLPTL